MRPSRRVGGAAAAHSPLGAMNRAGPAALADGFSLASEHQFTPGDGWLVDWRKPLGRLPMAKFVFVTGGVVSSLGKGITAASIGTILKARGLHVGMQKLDPYLNVDPGTMSPYQHGEVFVTDDGAETDLDLGHYERFVDVPLSKASNVT